MASFYGRERELAQLADWVTLERWGGESVRVRAAPRKSALAVRADASGAGALRGGALALSALMLPPVKYCWRTACGARTRVARRFAGQFGSDACACYCIICETSGRCWCWTTWKCCLRRAKARVACCRLRRLTDVCPPSVGPDRAPELSAADQSRRNRASWRPWRAVDAQSLLAPRRTGCAPPACNTGKKDGRGTTPERARLIEAYGGNPLALKIVAETIVELFGGDSPRSWGRGGWSLAVCANCWTSNLRAFADEQTVLSVAGHPARASKHRRLLAALATPLSRTQVFDVVEALRRRSLIERGQRRGSFTLQSVVLEYAAARLSDEIAGEIEAGRLSRLIEHGLEVAISQEYVRQTQQRLLVARCCCSCAAATRPRGTGAAPAALLARLRGACRLCPGLWPSQRAGLAVPPARTLAWPRSVAARHSRGLSARRRAAERHLA